MNVVSSGSASFALRDPDPVPYHRQVTTPSRNRFLEGRLWIQVFLLTAGSGFFLKVGSWSTLPGSAISLHYLEKCIFV